MFPSSLRPWTFDTGVFIYIYKKKNYFYGIKSRIFWIPNQTFSIFTQINKYLINFNITYNFRYASYVWTSIIVQLLTTLYYSLPIGPWRDTCNAFHCTTQNNTKRFIRNTRLQIKIRKTVNSTKIHVSE